MINNLCYMPVTGNLNHHDELQRDNFTHASQVQHSPFASSAIEFSARLPKITTRDDEATQTTPIAANVMTQITSFGRQELAMHHHQSPGNPRKDTLMRALRKHMTQYATFPGLTYELIRDHLPPSKAVKKGHMIVTRKGLTSTRSMAKQKAKSRRDIANFLSAEEAYLAEEDEIYCYIILGDK